MSKAGTAGPIGAEYVEKMKRLARFVDEIFNEDLKKKTTGFCLLVFPFGTEKGRINYISNAERSDMITAMKELIARFEWRHPEESGQVTDKTKQ